MGKRVKTAKIGADALGFESLPLRQAVQRTCSRLDQSPPGTPPFRGLCRAGVTPNLDPVAISASATF